MNETRPSRRLPALALGFACLAAACGSAAEETDGADTTASAAGTTTADATTTDDGTASDDGTTTDDGTNTEDTSGTGTLAGVEAAAWGANVTITVGDDSFRFESDGIPSHELPEQFLVPQEGSFTPPVGEEEVSVVDTDIAVVASPIDITIPLEPTWSDVPTDTGLGIIGVAVSGAMLFNDYEDPSRSFVAVDDNFAIDGVPFVDSCNGHPLALARDGSGQGQYHYHGVPYCITDAIDADGSHSSIIGFLRDGYPVYGPQDDGGVIITSDDLDECSGHVGPTPEFPEGIYHYHFTEDRSPYTVDCYHGVVN